MGALLAAARSIRADEHLATLRVGTEVYSNVTVTSVSVTDIFFTHSRGVGNAKLKNLDPAVQKMFHFDPAKSDAQQADQAKANALYNQAVRNSPPPKRSPAPEPEPEPQQPGTANGIRDHAIKAKSFLNQAAPSLQIEKWLTDQPDTSRTDVLAQSNVLPEIAAMEATNYMGQEVIVTDKVAQVTLRATVALINLNQKYPESPLTCVVRNQDTNKFLNLESYFGKRVEITGRIISYQGRPEIILTLPEQIKLLSDSPANDGDSPASAGAATALRAPAMDPPSSHQIPVAEVRSERTAWWIAGSLGVIILLLGLLVFLFWQRTSSPSRGSSSNLALVRISDEASDEATVAGWKQRALAAEAMAGKQGQLLREKIMPELAEFAKQSLVQGLFAQRNALLNAQEEAQRSLAELEARLASLQLPLQERIRAYEKRVAELEKEVASQDDGVRELTRATLSLVHRKLNDERQLQRAPDPLN